MLPILFGDRFVARFEPGRDDASGDLVVLGWWWEKDARPSSELKKALIRCFDGFRRYLGAGGVRVEAGARSGSRLSWLARAF